MMYLRIEEPECGEPVTVTIGRRGRGSLAFQKLDRETAETVGYLKGQRWLAFHHERQDSAAYHPWRRWGIAMGQRMLIAAWDGLNPDYDSDEATAVREADEQERRERARAWLAELKAQAALLPDYDDEEDYEDDEEEAACESGAVAAE
jgi:hypothetical protein